MNHVEYEPIGVIRTPFESPTGMPVQPVGDEAATGTVEVDESYADGLADLEEFSHCVLLYHFHASDGGFSLRVEPFLDDTDRGVFATRAPRRPNPIGISTVEVVSVEGARLTVDGIDVVDGTPLLDVKPFVGGFGVPENSDDGWLEDASGDAESRRADDRFQ